MGDIYRLGGQVQQLGFLRQKCEWPLFDGRITRDCLVDRVLDT
jgi:hypothetical protein